MVKKDANNFDSNRTPESVWFHPEKDYLGESPSAEDFLPVKGHLASSGNTHESRYSPLASENQQDKQLRRKSGWQFWLPFGGMLLLVIVFLWCLAFNFLGKRAYTNGEYEEAVSFFRKDFLLSQTMLWNAEYQNAAQKFQQGQFLQAAELYSMLGDKAHDSWLDAITAESKRLQRESSVEAALDYLERYAGEEEIDRSISRLQMQMAKEYLEKGQYTEAVSIVSEITYQDEVDLATFYDKAYYLMGTEALSEKNYVQAAEYLLECKDPSVRDYGTILKEIQSGCYYEAAQRIVAMETKVLDSYLKEPLASILSAGINENIGKDLNTRLDQLAAEKLLRSDWDTDTFSKERFSDDGVFLFFEGGKCIGEIQEESNLMPVTSLDALLQKTAITPAGKVLILREQYGYPKAEPYYGVDLGEMSRLPASVYPASLSEVEYLIILAYDYTQTGQGTMVYTYSDGSSVRSQDPVAILRLKAQVRAVALPSNQELYHSPVVQGGASPYAIGGGKDWKCGDPPRIGKYIYTAITKVMS